MRNGCFLALILAMGIGVPHSAEADPDYCTATRQIIDGNAHFRITCKDNGSDEWNKHTTEGFKNEHHLGNIPNTTSNEFTRVDHVYVDIKDLGDTSVHNTNGSVINLSHDFGGTLEVRRHWDEPTTDHKALNAVNKESAHGIEFAQSTGHGIIRTKGDITTNGASSHGITGKASKGKLLIESAGDITANGSGSHGITAEGRDAVKVVNSSDIVAKGASSHGVHMVWSSDSGTPAATRYDGGMADVTTMTLVNKAGATITANDSASHGVHMDHRNSKGDATIENKGTIEAKGNGAYGIYVHSQRAGHDVSIVNEGTVKASSGSAHAIHVNHVAALGKVSVDNKGTIEASGDENHLIYVQGKDSKDNITLTNSGTMTVAGDEAHVLYVDGTESTGLITLHNKTGGSVVTSSDESHAMYVKAHSSRSNIALNNQGTARASGEDSHAMYVDGASSLQNISVTNQGTVSSHTDGDHSMYVNGAQTRGQIDLVNQGSVSSSVAESHGMYLDGSGARGRLSILNARQGTVVTSADDSHAAYIKASSSQNNTSLVNFGTLRVSGANSHAMYLDGEGATGTLGAFNYNTVTSQTSGGHGMHVNSKRARGRIYVTNEGTVTSSVAGSHGMYVNATEATGNVIFSNTTNARVTASAADSHAVYVDAMLGTHDISLTNDGALTAGTSSSHAVHVDGRSGTGAMNLTNRGTMTAGAAGHHALYVTAANRTGIITLTNRGTIQATGNNSNGIHVTADSQQSGVTVHHESGGRLTKTGQGHGIYVRAQGGKGAITVRHHGITNAAVGQATGDGIHIDATNSNGAVTVEHKGTLNISQNGRAIAVKSGKGRIQVTFDKNSTISRPQSAGTALNASSAPRYFADIEGGSRDQLQPNMVVLNGNTQGAFRSTNGHDTLYIADDTASLDLTGAELGGGHDRLINRGSLNIKAGTHINGLDYFQQLPTGTLTVDMQNGDKDGMVIIGSAGMIEGGVMVDNFDFNQVKKGKPIYIVRTDGGMTYNPDADLASVVLKFRDFLCRFGSCPVLLGDEGGSLVSDEGGRSALTLSDHTDVMRVTSGGKDYLVRMGSLGISVLADDDFARYSSSLTPRQRAIANYLDAISSDNPSWLNQMLENNFLSLRHDDGYGAALDQWGGLVYRVLPHSMMDGDRRFATDLHRRDVCDDDDTSRMGKRQRSRVGLVCATLDMKGSYFKRNGDSEHLAFTESGLIVDFLSVLHFAHEWSMEYGFSYSFNDGEDDMASSWKRHRLQGLVGLRHENRLSSSVTWQSFAGLVAGMDFHDVQRSFSQTNWRMVTASPKTESVSGHGRTGFVQQASSFSWGGAMDIRLGQVSSNSFTEEGSAAVAWEFANQSNNFGDIGISLFYEDGEAEHGHQSHGFADEFKPFVTVGAYYQFMGRDVSLDGRLRGSRSEAVLSLTDERAAMTVDADVGMNFQYSDMDVNLRYQSSYGFVGALSMSHRGVFAVRF